MFNLTKLGKKSLVLSIVLLVVLLLATTAIATHISAHNAKKNLNKTLKQEKLNSPSALVSNFSQTRQPTGEEIQTAIASVKRFMKKPNLNLQPKYVIKSLGEEKCMLSSGKDDFQVSLKTGEITGAYFHSVAERTTNQVNVSHEQAKNTAEKFAIEHFINFFSEMDMKLVREELRDRGSFKEYEFEWGGEDKTTQSWLTVKVSPTTGEIKSCSSLKREITVDLNPKIPKKKAIQIAKRAVEFYLNKVKRIDLEVGYDDEENQVLMWIIELRGKPPVVDLKESPKMRELQGIAFVMINAYTGKVIRIIRPS